MNGFDLRSHSSFFVVPFSGEYADSSSSSSATTLTTSPIVFYTFQTCYNAGKSYIDPACVENYFLFSMFKEVVRSPMHMAIICAGLACITIPVTMMCIFKNVIVSRALKSIAATKTFYAMLAFTNFLLVLLVAVGITLTTNTIRFLSELNQSLGGLTESLPSSNGPTYTQTVLKAITDNYNDYKTIHVAAGAVPLWISVAVLLFAGFRMSLLFHEPNRNANSHVTNGLMILPAPAVGGGAVGVAVQGEVKLDA